MYIIKNIFYRNISMTLAERRTYELLLKTIEQASPTERPNRIYHLKSFVEVVNLRISQTILEDEL